MEAINNILKKFRPVSLSEIDEVKLMNRIDRKYWFHISDLSDILHETIPFYDILEINGHRLMDYETTYFDTPDNKMFRFHHNRKLNRFKIRRRRYHSTESDFLEIKLKNNKRRTIKKRIETTLNGSAFSNDESGFIGENSPFESLNLNPTLKNNFQRITLVNKEKTDRCTLDMNLGFENKSGKINFENLVIVELKRGRNLKSSFIISLLRKKHVRQRGLSKYCTGRAMLEPELKQNAFKPRLRYLRRKILGEIYNN